MSGQRDNRPSPEAIRRAGATLAAGDLAMAQMTPREQAEAAWTPTAPFHPGGPKSVDELEDRIRARRGLPPLPHERGGKTH